MAFLLACITLSGSVTFEVFADFVDVLGAQLRSAAWMTVKAGFLWLHRPSVEGERYNLAGPPYCPFQPLSLSIYRAQAQSCC